jgi:uncharacterized membrane protein
VTSSVDRKVFSVPPDASQSETASDRFRLRADEETLLRRLRELEPARNANISAPLTRAAQYADRIAIGVGSWRFVFLQTIFLCAWLALNVMGWIAGWDPYPFILLNLILSIQAAYTAPILMMSQNRQASIDRSHAISDYEVNLQAALEIKLLQQKIDELTTLEFPALRATLARIESGHDAEMDYSDCQNGSAI